MKKVINGKLYDTETAREVGSDSYLYPRDFNHWVETLYVKRSGEYFLHGQGGPRSRYAVSVGQNSWEGGEKIIPLSFENARKWAEEHMDADDYAEAFGMPDEGESDEKATLCVQVPADLAAVVKRQAAEQGISLTAYVAQALRMAAKGAGQAVAQAAQAEKDDGKCWVIIDDCTTKAGSVWDERIEAHSKAEAERIARAQWDALTPHDQQRRDEYYVAYAGLDEHGCVDYDSIEKIVYIKKRY